MSSPKELLEGLPTGDKVEVVIGGHKFLCRTSLRVDDAMALPANFFDLSGLAANALLFRLLGCAANGMRAFEDGDDSWYKNLDAIQIHKGMEAAGVRQMILEQLVPDADEEAAEQDAEGKSPS